MPPKTIAALSANGGDGSEAALATRYTQLASKFGSLLRYGSVIPRPKGKRYHGGPIDGLEIKIIL
jgi:hypothetical protein